MNATTIVYSVNTGLVQKLALVQELLVNVIVVGHLVNLGSKSDMITKTNLFKYKRLKSEIIFSSSFFWWKGSHLQS